MTSYKDPITIHITLSPAELRQFADKCEVAAANSELGRTTFVDFLAYTKDYVVSLYFDQEKTKGA